MSFPDTVTRVSFVLAEGSLRERLHRNPMITLDPQVDHDGFVCDSTGGAVLERLDREHLEIGRVADVPFVVCTPTHRANPERLRKAGVGEQTDSRDAMDSEEAASFHEQQACMLSDVGVDPLTAATDEATGYSSGRTCAW
jgi:hypothetical protein